MIRDQNPTCFTVEADKIFGASSIGRRGTSKGKVNGETLKRNSGGSGAMGTSRCLRLFGPNASRA